MELAQSIGQRVKGIRKARHMTLKELSEMTGLSSGFLSQFERGLTNIAIDSLSKIAYALEALKQQYSMKEIGENIGISGAAIHKLINK